MPTVVGVSFKPVTKVYYFDPGPFLDLQAGDFVVVETSQGREIGEVVWRPREIADDEVGDRLKPVVRRATVWDMIERDQYKHREQEALEICRTKVAEHGLPMKVVAAEYSYDGGRLVVTFTAEGRVDFRELVRDLAKTFYTRIEMKQIGVRDQAKATDGMGKCGRRLCCASWLREFNPVTIKMAKQQNLPLNPTEISGVCGRLLCCLAYEVDVYNEARQQLPKVGSAVVTPEGKGRVRKVHPLRNVITVRLEEEGVVREFSVADLVSDGQRGCAGCAARRTQRARTGAQEAPPSSEADRPSVEQQVSSSSSPTAGWRRQRSKRRRRKPRSK